MDVSHALKGLNTYFKLSLKLILPGGFFKFLIKWLTAFLIFRQSSTNTVLRKYLFPVKYLV